MRVMKFYMKSKVKYMEVVKVASVLFDSRPDWILVQELDKAQHRKELFWVHPDEVDVEWVREFSFETA